jgi:uncharacterized glyoxalase superfamily protein PhnB
MPFLPGNTLSPVVPCIRYRDAPRAVDWLCQVFGFKPHLIVLGENGKISHGQLTLGNGMLMLGSLSNENEYGKLIVTPEQIDGAQTQTIYLTVDDADQVYARVKAAGAAILIDIEDAGYGGRGFTCRDLEGHVWSIGTYDPSQEQAT